MEIWVDADACPRVIKDILFRAAGRHEIQVTLVANQSLQVQPSRFIRTLRVAAGFDVADNEIVKRAAAGDLVITADIPLAAEVLAKGAIALNPRGELYQHHDSRKTDPTGFYGYPVRQRHPDGRFIAARAARTPGICASVGQMAASGSNATLIYSTLSQLFMTR